MTHPMHVQTYLRTHGIEKLQSELGIKVKSYPEEGLLVLNYSQIDSPKSHPVVVECRGLILDYHFNVVSRSMDRQFIQEYVDKFNDIMQELELAYAAYRTIQDQKEFALAIRSVQGNSVLFTARKMNISPKVAFKLMPDAAKLKMLMGAN